MTIPGEPGVIPKRELPDLDKCRAKWAGFGDYADCKVSRPEQCLYSLRFGDGHLCLHHQRAEIVARSIGSGSSVVYV